MTQLPEKIYPVEYAGFFDFNESGKYDDSVINRDDYENAEEIANEIARRYNDFPKWINVNDRLPEYMQVVLICVKDLRFVIQAQYGGQNAIFSVGDYWYTATHWMLLPEPPKP